jgi:hypothetical protein
MESFYHHFAAVATAASLLIYFYAVNYSNIGYIIA